MAQAFVVGGGGGGVGSEELSAVAANVLKGNTYVGKDTNDDIGTGTLELTGNAAAGDVVSGKTFYSNNPHSRLTGTLALSGNAGAAQVLTGYTFYSNSWTRQSGSMANNAAWGTTLAVNGSAKVPAGYHNGSGVVKGPSLTALGATTYYPGTANKTIVNSGVYTTGALTLAGVTQSNIAAGNIKHGVGVSVKTGSTTLYSATGSYYGEGNAAASDVRSGKTFSNSSGSNISGSLTTYSGATSVTPSTGSQTLATSGKIVGSNITIAAIPSTYKQVGSTTSFFDFGGARYKINDDIAYSWNTYADIKTLPSYAKGTEITSKTKYMTNYIIFRPVRIKDIFSNYTCTLTFTGSFKNASDDVEPEVYLCKDYYSIDLGYRANYVTPNDFTGSNGSVVTKTITLTIDTWTPQTAGAYYIKEPKTLMDNVEWCVFKLSNNTGSTTNATATMKVNDFTFKIV